MDQRPTPLAAGGAPAAAWRAVEPWALNAVVCLMGLCFVAPASALAGLLVPGAYARLLPVLGVLVCAEAIYAKASIGRMDATHNAWWRYRVGEWAVLLTALKVVVFIVDPARNAGREAPLWLQNPVAFFWDPPFFASLLVIIVAWLMATVLSTDVRELRVPDEASLAIESSTGVRRSLSDVRRALASHTVWFGCMAGLATGAANALGGGAAAGSGYVFVYFGLALTLLGVTHYNVTLTGWMRERAPVEPNLAARWAAVGGLLLASLIACAALAPTSFAGGLLAALGRLLGGLMYLLLLLSYFVTQLLSLLYFGALYLMSLLFGTPAPTAPSQAPPSIEPFMSPPQDAAPDWLAALQALVVWVIAAVLIASSVYVFVGRRAAFRSPASGLRGLIAGVLGMLRAFWRAVRVRGLTPLATFIRAQIGRVAALSRPGGAVSRWIALRADLDAMSPRDRVLFYYRAMLERNARSGVARRPAQTPSEYAGVLNEAAPDAAPDVAELTSALTEARYTPHAVDPDQAGLARRAAARVRAALSGRRARRP